MQQRARALPEAALAQRWRWPIREPWLYLAPALVWFAVFAVFPLFYTVVVSVSDWSIADHPVVGFRHYAALLQDTALLASIRATAIFTVGTLALAFVLGFAIALLLASDLLYASSFFRSVLILPSVISPVVVGISFRLMLHPILGVINYVLGTTGRDWLGSPDTAMLSVILITVWELTPFFALILLAGLLALPRDPYDAAKVDGAGVLATFRFLTLPLLRPVCQVGLLMGVIDVLKVFAIIFATTQGGPAGLTEVLGLYIWRTGFRFYRLDYAAALAVVFVIAIAVLAWFTMRALGERSQSETGAV